LEDRIWISEYAGFSFFLNCFFNSFKNEQASLTLGKDTRKYNIPAAMGSEEDLKPGWCNSAAKNKLVWKVLSRSVLISKLPITNHAIYG